MDLRALKLRNRKTCDCGHEFTNQDVRPPIIINKDYRYYGGRVECYTKAICPKCGQEVYLLLESYDNRYRVIDIGTDSKPIIFEEPIQEVPKEESKEEMQEVKEETQFKCEKCGREFKSKSGLASHSRKCN